MLTLAVTYAGVLGGAERTLLSFARALPGEVALACPDGALADRARSEGLTVFVLPTRALELRGGAAASLRAVGGLAGHAVEIRRLSEALHPELVLAWGMRSAIAAACARARLARRPALLVRHVDFLPGPLVARAVRAAAARADRVSVNSQAVARDLDPRAKLGERLGVLYPGVELDAYPHAWNVGSQPEALLLGALVPWKRPDLALEAVALASRKLPKLRFTVAGAPMGEAGEQLREALRRRAAEPDLAGRVRFLGGLGDPREALARAWCLLHCADREPFGSVLIEALASGRPVVAPAAGGPAEIVDETCGRLYSPDSVQAAADALVGVLSSEEQARALGAAGRARAARFELSKARQRFAKQAHEAMRAASVPTSAPSASAGLALVTVTHNSGSVLPRLLRSAQRHLPGAPLIVVDSGSRDDSVEVARASHAEVTVLDLGENVGFGRASNAGVAQAGEPICALVNPDVELIDDSLQTLARELLAPGAPERILTPLVLSPDGRRQNTAHPQPGSPHLFLKALLPATILPPPIGTWVEPWRSRGRRKVGWAVGCCLVAPTATLRRLGPFDERIFLFGEDMDLGLKAALEGVETWFCPDARVLHLDAHSTLSAFGGEPFDLLARQRRAVAGEQLGPRAARRDHLALLLTYADRIAVKALGRRPNARERRQLVAQWQARKSAAALGISERLGRR